MRTPCAHATATMRHQDTMREDTTHEDPTPDAKPRARNRKPRQRCEDLMTAKIVTRAHCSHLSRVNHTPIVARPRDLFHRQDWAKQRFRLTVSNFSHSTASLYMLVLWGYRFRKLLQHIYDEHAHLFFWGNEVDISRSTCISSMVGANCFGATGPEISLAAHRGRIRIPTTQTSKSFNRESSC